MNKWVDVGQENAAAGIRSILTWGEITGYIRVPSCYGDFCIVAPLNSPASYELVLDGKVVASNWTSKTETGKSLNIPAGYDLLFKGHAVAGTSVTDAGQLSRSEVLIHDGIEDPMGEFKSFRLRIGCAYQNSHEDYAVSNFYLSSDKILRILGDGQVWWYRGGNTPIIQNDVFYAMLALQDMKKFFELNPTDFTLNLDPDLHKEFPASDYVYGICTGDAANRCGRFQDPAAGNERTGARQRKSICKE